MTLRNRGRNFRVPATAAAVWLSHALLAGVLVTQRRYGSRAESDQLYHWATIRRFSLDWPNVDLSIYLSATTPGYHLLMVWPFRALGGDLTALRLSGVGLTLVGLAWLLWRVRHVTPLLWLPFTCSLYVLCSSAWLLPDNVAWLLLGAVLLLTIQRRWTTRVFVAAALLLGLLVFTRQVHAWAMLPVVLAAGVREDDLGRLHIDRRGSLLGLAATLPALAVLGWLVAKWHGLAPPLFTAEIGPGPLRPFSLDHQGANPALPALFFGVLGVAGPFFLPFLRQEWLGRARWPILLLAAVIVAATISLVPATSYLFPGRASGLWNVVKVFPTVADRSVVLPFFCLAGVLVAGLWLTMMAPRARVIATATVFGFLLANSVNAMAWQRYVEPFVLLLLPLWVMQTPDAAPKRAKVGLVALAAVLLAVSAGSLWRDPISASGSSVANPDPVFLLPASQLRDMLEAERIS